jgi:hypothetical protein
MKRVVLLLLLALAAACSKDRDLRITDQNKNAVIDQIKDSHSFTPDEVRLLLARQMRVGIAEAQQEPSPDWVGKTLAEVIEDERKVEQDAKAKQAEADRLAAQAKAKEDANAAELRKAVSFAVFDKGFVPSDPYTSRYDDYITFKCVYQNLSGKDIRAFTGSVRFANLFDREIMTMSVTVDDPIKAGEKASWNGTLKYNQFREDHQGLRNAELTNLKVTWIPQQIIFADGSRIGEGQR